MKVAKRFRWEGAHRLPWHTGGCQNLHGHSYQMWVELKGTLDENGMLLDFKDIKQYLAPLVEEWDHAVLIAKADTELLAAMKGLQSKHYVLPYDTTSENLCLFVTEYLAGKALDVMIEMQVTHVCVRLQETETCYAEYEVSVAALQARRTKAKGALAV